MNETGKDHGLNLACVGINHRTAQLDVRESMWFSADEMAAALKRLREARAREAILISTCNRTELYYVPAGGGDARPMWEFLSSLKDNRPAAGPDNFYTLAGLQR